jgi:hypothetical protein
MAYIHDSASTRNSFADLADVPIWVAWREETRKGRLTKVPKNPATGNNASVPTNPRTYGTRAAAEQRGRKIQKTAIGGFGIVLGKLPRRQRKTTPGRSGLALLSRPDRSR